MLPNTSQFFNENSSTIRSSSGCWTCRLRRKKCDEQHPVCDTCTILRITCHYDTIKPEWMDGGARQEEMAARVKREVKEKASHRRRGDRKAGDRNSVVEALTDPWIVVHRHPPMNPAAPTSDIIPHALNVRNGGIELCPEASVSQLQRGGDCTLANGDGSDGMAFGRSDTILLMFYLEHVLPILFPFYRPSPLEGGRAWVLEMMISSAVVRQATLCQSSYFFSLARGVATGQVVWDTVLAQTNDAFGALRRSLQVIASSDITEHLHGAVRIMASIIQVQRFEIAVSSFDNCHAHLNAALALFKQLLGSPGLIEPAGPSASFNVVIDHLGPPSWIFPTRCAQVPSAEQAAFRFSSALLILDDIITSTVLQEQPRLYEYHASLLDSADDGDPTIDLETTVGCQNWTLLHIGEIAVLDAWKQQCKRAGDLDVMELVRRATVIKNSLEAHLVRLEEDPIIVPKQGCRLLDVFSADYSQHSRTPTNKSSFATRIWAHAALIYLSVVVSGWQPASVDVRYHVGRIVELFTRQISPPGLLRTMVWPFCVAGCLAESTQEHRFRGMMDTLQPASIFGTVRKALDIMETVWRNRNTGDATARDLATCFRSQGHLVLLV